jgi:hypothetical protein
MLIEFGKIKGLINQFKYSLILNIAVQIYRDKNYTIELIVFSFTSPSPSPCTFTRHTPFCPAHQVQITADLLPVLLLAETATGTSTTLSVYL